MKTTIAAAALGLMAAPVLAQDAMGDPAAGEEQFNRQCVACHVVQNDDGEVLAGRNAQTGPNLYGVAGRTIGAVEDFRYSDAIMTLNEQGEEWDEEKFVAYVQDPTGWLRETLDDRRARGKMAYQVRAEEDAHDLWAFLATFSEEGETEAEGEGADG